MSGMPTIFAVRFPGLERDEVKPVVKVKVNHFGQERSEICLIPITALGAPDELHVDVSVCLSLFILR